VDAKTIQRLPASGARSFAGSPADHQLLIADQTDVGLLADGRQPNGAASQLTGPECGGGVWNLRP
jgi:hypothetical protein